jgi:hypothetical protein
VTKFNFTDLKPVRFEWADDDGEGLVADPVLRTKESAAMPMRGQPEMTPSGPTEGIAAAHIAKLEGENADLRHLLREMGEMRDSLVVAIGNMTREIARLQARIGELTAKLPLAADRLPVAARDAKPAVPVRGILAPALDARPAAAFWPEGEA